MARSILLVLLGLAASGPSIEGCYGVDNRLTLMPDGSGKIDVHLSAKVDEQKPTDLLEIAKLTEGFVALTPAVDEFKDGWKHSRFTAYFEDINRVRYNRQCDGLSHDGCLHFSFHGSTLVMEDWVFNKKPTWESARDDSSNVLKWKFAMPGKVTKVEGFQRMEGREAVFERSPKTITTMEEAEKWSPCARRRIECGKSEIPEPDQAAFKKELGTAKAAWAKLKADLEAVKSK